MINLDEDALICDFAETYGLFDYRGLSPLKAAVLSCGLRENSRIKMKLANAKLTIEQTLLAVIADFTQAIMLGDKKNIEQNFHSIQEQLINPEKQKEKYMKFESVQQYEAFYRAKMRYKNG